MGAVQLEVYTFRRNAIFKSKCWVWCSGAYIGGCVEWFEVLVAGSQEGLSEVTGECSCKLGRDGVICNCRLIEGLRKWMCIASDISHCCLCRWQSRTIVFFKICSHSSQSECTKLWCLHMAPFWNCKLIAFVSVFSRSCQCTWSLGDFNNSFKLTHARTAIDFNSVYIYVYVMPKRDTCLVTLLGKNFA